MHTLLDHLIIQDFGGVGACSSLERVWACRQWSPGAETLPPWSAVKPPELSCKHFTIIGIVDMSNSNCRLDINTTVVNTTGNLVYHNVTDSTIQYSFIAS